MSLIVRTINRTDKMLFLFKNSCESGCEFDRVSADFICSTSESDSNAEPSPEIAAEPEPKNASPEPEPELPSAEPEPEVSSADPEPQSEVSVNTMRD